MEFLVKSTRPETLKTATLVVALGEYGRTPKINNRGGRDHWSLQPVRRPTIPGVGSHEAADNPIDAFILQRLAPDLTALHVFDATSGRRLDPA